MKQNLINLALSAFLVLLLLSSRNAEAQTINCIKDPRLSEIPDMYAGIIKKSEELLKHLYTINFKGEPEKDWIAIRDLLKNSSCPRLQEIAEHASYLRLLGKEKLLRESLAKSWRKHGCYENAREIFEDAFKQEHFSASAMNANGIIIMNMHKGKEKNLMK